MQTKVDFGRVFRASNPILPTIAHVIIPPMEKLRGILFDNDGTLVDTYDLLLTSFRHATREVLGHQLPDEVLMAGVGTPLAQQMADFTDDPATQTELLRVYRAYNEQRHDSVICAFPGILDALRTLRDRGMKMGVVTSKMRPLAQRGLDVTGISPYLDCVIGAADCPKAKPDPDPILLGCEMLGLQPAECAYIGDSPFDIRAANAAGCVSVAVLWGMFSADVLAAEHPDITIESPAELARL